MQLTDLAVLKQLNAWLKVGETVWLCSIVSTYGSAPRPVGSLFATNGQQRVGSISGGCLEQAFFEKLQADEFQCPAQLFDYNSQLNRSGQPSELPCGGSIQLLVEKLVANDVSQKHVAQWLTHAQSYHAFERHVDLQQGLIALNIIEDIPRKEIELLENAVILRYAQVWSLLLLGISQVTEHVARLGLMAGYQVRVCDNREEMASAWHFSAANGGVDVEWKDPGLFVEQYASPRAAVLALAHDPRVDDVGLMSGFEQPNFYMGAMGSQVTTRKRRERMQRICQLEDAVLDKLHAPIGMDIGSKTPVEIAISIMAALTLHKSRSVL